MLNPLAVVARLEVSQLTNVLCAAASPANGITAYDECLCTVALHLRSIMSLCAKDSYV